MSIVYLTNFHFYFQSALLVVTLLSHLILSLFVFQSPKTFPLFSAQEQAWGQFEKRPAHKTTEGPHASAGTYVVQFLFIDERGISVVVTCSLQGYRGGQPFHG